MRHTHNFTIFFSFSANIFWRASRLKKIEKLQTIRLLVEKYLSQMLQCRSSKIQIFCSFCQDLLKILILGTENVFKFFWKCVIQFPLCLFISRPVVRRTNMRNKNILFGLLVTLTNITCKIIQRSVLHAIHTINMSNGCSIVDKQ